MKTPRFLVVVLLLLGTGALLHLRGDVDRVPKSEPLGHLATTIDSMSSQDIAIDPAVLEVLGKGVFLNRVYAPTSRQAAAGTSAPDASPAGARPIGLFIGYFPTQRSGQSIHSPQNCLPGSGWTFDSSGVTEIADPTGKHYRVGEYLISNGRARQEVLYWYQSHGRSIASDYRAKFFMIADSIRLGRTDAALVRVITPLLPGEERTDAHNRVVHFAQSVLPMLPSFIPN